MKKLTVPITVLICLSLSLGCSRKRSNASAGAPEVVVTEVTRKDVPIVKEWVATLDGLVNAGISARVSGYLISQDYKEGTAVKKGDLLFQIDPRPFEEALAQAKATLAKAQATQLKADQDKKRALELFNKQVTSQQERDAALQAAAAAKGDTEADQAAVNAAELLFNKQVTSQQERDAALQAAAAAKGDTEADQAAVNAAELNLEYTKITAPIDGIAGFATAQVGDLVGPSTGLLTTISQVDPIKAVITASEQAYTEFATRYSDPEKREEYLKSKVEFELVLANGAVYPQRGKFYAVDRNVDVQTGSIRFEAIFSNPENILRPVSFPVSPADFISSSHLPLQFR